MSASTSAHKLCPLCKERFQDDGDVVEVRQKGADGINAASAQRGDDIVVAAGCKVHSGCRKRYINPHDIENQQKKDSSSKLPLKRSARVSTGPFNSKSDCLFCGTRVDLGGSDYSFVKTDTFARTIRECCESRSDDWSFTVKGRIEYYCGDLHAADCIYHHACSVNFRSGHDLPLKFRCETDAKRKKGGRPTDADQEQAFLRMCSYLEMNDEEQLTISCLENKMGEFLIRHESAPYATRYLKSKLQEKYGDSIFIAESKGLNDIVTFREKTADILRSYYKDAQREGDEEAQRRAIIETAARLIKSDIKSNVPPVTDSYPQADQLKVDSAMDFLPDTLQNMLKYLFVGKDTHRKVASIGQAIVQAVRPRAVIAPLQIGLAVQVHHVCRSKFLVDTLHKMGYCLSYGEVLRFEKNAASCIIPDLLVEGIDVVESSLLFAADNVDHNIQTIDGKGTFHGMGMVAAMTPGRKTMHHVSRRNIADLNIVEMSTVDIMEYRFANDALRSIRFQELPDLENCDMRPDILWELSLHFKQQTPHWQGMMHVIHQGYAHPGQSSILYLPMIDMHPGDRNCILSTLEFISNLASRHHIPPILTFDQPLYWKAKEIISAAPRNSHLKEIVLLLGSFHTFMNLLGAIGTLMQGTGLTSVLGVAYGDNAVVHMMTGKSVQRAFRGHLLVDKCLHQMTVKSVVDEDLHFGSLIDETEEMYTSLLKGENTLESLVASTAVARITETLNKKKAEFSAQSKTSQLWLGYQRMLHTARALIKSDRTGSWLNHLCAVSDALPIFAAAGHYNYLKSAYLYVQDMTDLESKHPEVYRKFQEGYHVIRRTNQFWAGLGCDLVIEQTLMKSLKSTGGLTHGSTMTEQQRALWTMSAPIMCEFNTAMQDFNDLSYTTSEQHKDSTDARMERNASDLAKISAKLTSCSPFSSDPSLRNIINGIVAKEDVNVNEYESIGKNIIKRMIEQPVFSFSFKRSDKAKTLANSSAVKVAPDRTIDPGLLFQRFLVASRTGHLSIEEVMTYELSPYPSSLFEDKNTLRKADKPQLAHAMYDHCNKMPSSETTSDVVPKTERYVLDGGNLLRKLKWMKGDTYGKISKAYADFTIKHYGVATVVFDGYEAGPTIKDNTHRRRKQNIHYPLVNFSSETEFDGKQEEFLSVGSNKQQLISLTSDQLRMVGCSVIQAEGDADVDIAKAAVSTASVHTTTLIGEDTDLLILLLHYAEIDGKPLYFRSDTQSRGLPKVYNINCLKQSLGSELCTQLLFLHAFTGCDSTSRIYGIGKKSAFLKLITGNQILQSCAKTFTSPGKNRTEIENLGCQAMAAIFGGKNTSALATLRYDLLCKKVVSAKSFVMPERLPPTESSTNFHCLRVYFQTMTWMGMASNIDPLNWGWKLEDNQLVPIMSSMNAAPDSLLKIVHCNCASGCNTARCSCRTYGLPCASACGSCQLTSCDNPHNHQDFLDELEEDSSDD
jgi:5'-3' exonuclease